MEFIQYFKDNELSIVFTKNPHVDVRYPCPGDTESQKKNKLKKPFINKEEIGVHILYKPKKQLNTYTYNFIIPKDYTWDGASIPRFCWRLIGSNTDPRFLIASMVHDILCENHAYINNNRYLSTLILEKLCQTGGTPAWSRWAIKHSVDNYQKIVGGWNSGK
jgi:hypothetical protein